MRFGRPTVKAMQLKCAFDSFVGALESGAFNPRESEGFLLRESSSDFLLFYYIAKYITNQSRFDPDTLQIKTEQVTEFRVAPLIYDHCFGTLDVFGPKLLVAEAISKLSELHDVSFSVSDIVFDLGGKLRKWVLNGDVTEVRTMRLRDIPIGIDAVATCNVSVSSLETAAHILDIYRKNVVSVNVRFAVNQGKYIVTIYNDGSFSASIDIEERWDEYRQLKRMILEGPLYG